ncbi:response regulator transcription factor [Olivibacter sp. SDN3]|uniref:response regulator n=1 Tax=Olivibacter sp. SDN3 TaxID=2764720 RepID=UPI0016516BB8|nr:response regulator [Olivibacter sp. SDN3]QNL51899.1 response regulator transcription factor [Olivibacter sp. SDN3]
MFKKVLIAEDHQSANISVQKTLEDFGISKANYVFYCDDALTWIRNAYKKEEAYDLLITDLFFEEDHHKSKLAGGAQLIKVVKNEQPNLKIIVFSAESRPAAVDTLFKELSIDGYVRKARNDAQALKEAIHAVYKGGKYISPDLRQKIKQQNSYEFSSFDITIISLLAQGMLQKDIPLYLQQHNIKPAGLSSIEKRLNLMKEVLEFSKNEQLVAYCKDMGII